MWDAAIEIWKAAPLVGVGNGHTEILAELLEQEKVHPHFEFYRDPSHYHNQYLNILAMKGGLGFILFLFLISLAFKTALGQKNQLPRYAMFSVLTIYLTSSLSDVPFRRPDTIALFFVLFYLLATIDMRTNTIQQEKNKGHAHD